MLRKSFKTSLLAFHQLEIPIYRNQVLPFILGPGILGMAYGNNSNSPVEKKRPCICANVEPIANDSGKVLIGVT